MARTTATAVREVLVTTLTDTQITAFINDVDVWVSEELTSAGISDTRLEVIERYLACAMIRIRDLGLASGSIENVSEKYQVDPEVTDYLLRAASFDPTGKVRQTFLAPKPLAQPGALAVRFGFGTRFVDEDPKDPNAI